MKAKRMEAGVEIGKDSYELYDISRLMREGILEGESSGYTWKHIREIFNGENIQFTHEKHREIATIGRARFYKKNKDKQYYEATIYR